MYTVFQVDVVSRCCVHFTSKLFGRCANVVDIRLGRYRTMQRDLPRCQYNQQSSIFDIWGSVAVCDCPVSADILLWKNPREAEKGEHPSGTWPFRWRHGNHRKKPSGRNEPFASERHQNNDYNFLYFLGYMASSYDISPVLGSATLYYFEIGLFFLNAWLDPFIYVLSLKEVRQQFVKCISCIWSNPGPIFNVRWSCDTLVRGSSQV